MVAQNNSGSVEDPDEGRSSLRATTEERERVLAELSEATARGQLDLGEFDERSAVAWAARSHGELAALLEDIVADPMAVILGPSRRGSRSPAKRGVDGGTGVVKVDEQGDLLPDATAGVARVTGETGSGWSVAVMSGVEKNGEWACGSQHRVVTVMGGGLLDLRDAFFEARETVITVTAVMGGVEILVPEDVRVVEHGFGLMGGFGSARSKAARLRNADLPADAPVVRVQGLAVMGGVEVKTVPRHRRKRS